MQPRRLLLHGGDDLRVAVAGVADRDAAEEVEVLVAVGVPQPRALAAHELDVVAGVVGDQAAPAHEGGPDLRADAGVGEQLEQQRVRHAAVDDVREGTPPWIASRQACSFGRMPPAIVVERRLDLVGAGLGDHATPGRRGRAASPRRR